LLPHEKLRRARYWLILLVDSIAVSTRRLEEFKPFKPFKTVNRFNASGRRVIWCSSHPRFEIQILIASA